MTAKIRDTWAKGNFCVLHCSSCPSCQTPHHDMQSYVYETPWPSVVWVCFLLLFAIGPPLQPCPSDQWKTKNAMWKSWKIRANTYITICSENKSLMTPYCRGSCGLISQTQKYKRLAYSNVKWDRKKLNCESNWATKGPVQANGSCVHTKEVILLIYYSKTKQRSNVKP